MSFIKIYVLTSDTQKWDEHIFTGNVLLSPAAVLFKCISVLISMVSNVCHESLN